jgi:hypothetical protein
MPMKCLHVDRVITSVFDWLNKFVVYFNFATIRSSINGDVETSGVGSSCAVSAIMAFSKGFACTSGPGTVQIFEKSDDKEFYRKSREITVSILFCKDSKFLDTHSTYRINIQYILVHLQRKNACERLLNIADIRTVQSISVEQ